MIRIWNKGWVFFIALAWGWAAQGFGEVTAVIHPKQVTVFPDSARVTREGSLELKSGSQRVIFPDLPASVVESSLRLTVEGPQGTKLYGVNLRNDYTSDVVEERTRILRSKIQALEDQKTDLSDQIEARKTEVELLKALGKEGTQTATTQGPTHPEALVDFTHSADAVGKRITLLMAANRKDERAARNLAGRIQALKNQLSEGSAPAREKRVAEADLDLPEAGLVRFSLAYQVSGASWSPLYDLRLNTEGEKPGLNLDFNAGVRQHTGEDWKNVALTLSTSRPTESTQVPDPTNWWLDFQNFTPRPVTRTFGALGYARLEKAEHKKVADEAAEAPPAPAEVVEAETVRSEYAVSFSIPVRRDVPSDGSEHRVGIVQQSHPVKLTLVVVPRLSQTAYLEAKITYNGEQALLPGKAQLFRDGDFVGTASLSAKAPGEAFELGFGQDNQVHVERKAMKELAGKAGGLFDFNKGESQYRWVTTISNYHQGNRSIVVREQLPRSRQKNIEVESGDLLPKPEKENPDKPGLVCWKLELKPKQNQKIDFSYKVKFPSGSDVEGLE